MAPWHARGGTNPGAPAVIINNYIAYSAVCAAAKVFARRLSSAFRLTVGDAPLVVDD